MFIQTETTPNPNTLKFTCGQEIIAEEPINFSNKESAENSNLAQELFRIENVKGVFFGYDFITITKVDEANWDTLKISLLTIITEYLVSKKPILKSRSSVDNNGQDDNDLVKQIKELIETRVRPAVAQDGGDIIFKEFTDGIVKLELHGACSGCPSSTVTLKEGIENMLKYYVPEIIAVESV